MTKEEFFDKIKITEEEKRKSEYFLKYRGIAAHEHVRQFLSSLTGNVVSYSAIATTFRYDKRIRRILYKYIGFLEESIRAFISNNYDGKISEIKINRKKTIEVNQNNSLYKRLCELTFGELINQIIENQIIDTKKLFPQYENREKDFKNDLAALVTLRNEVSHNRFLLDCVRLPKCNVGDKNNSLWANFINLGRLLPKQMQDSYVREIKEAQFATENIYENQTDWDLLPNIIITVDDYCFQGIERQNK